jgi:hypothetical protein
MNPYPGLRPFTSDEANLFFGREALDGLLETRVHVSPVTLLFARSGVGKSSFLTCRFIPSLKKRARVTYLNEWGSTETATAIRNVLEAVRTDEDLFDEYPVVVFDQFEDVFKVDGHRDILWDTLAEFANLPQGRVRILISMREEWLGAWAEVSDYIPDSQISLVRLAPLRDSEVMRAITRPASTDGSHTMDAALAHRIAEDLKRPNAYGLGAKYVEPGMIQIVCGRLWEEAQQKQRKVIDPELYDGLGGADEIIRRFVWRKLESCTSQTALFSAIDRVMFVGLSPHLSAAQGVKAIVTPSSLCKKLRLTDLGVAGPAVLDYELTRKERGYLSKMPEKRAAPPTALLTWVTRVLNVGVEAGLLKRQNGLQLGEPVYELSHDLLSPILQRFSVEFESWVRKRWYKVLAAGFATLVVLPLVVLLAVLYGWASILYIVAGALVFALYVGFIWVLSKIMLVALEALTFPILRRVVKGDLRDVPASGVSGGAR